MEHFDSEYYNQDTADSVSQKLRELGQDEKCFDARRFVLTIEYMKKFGLDHGPCVEIGSLEYPSAKVIWSFFPESSPIATSNDLRSERINFASGSVGSVICLEVLEHISDVKYREATTLDGLFFFLEELYRILRVGGRALITTPNPTSLWAMSRMLRGDHPMMYDWHFREYTPSELFQIVEHVGFNVVSHTTEFSWHLWNFSDIEKLLREGNYPAEMRGDDQFLVIEKPAHQIRKPHRLNLPV